MARKQTQQPVVEQPDPDAALAETFEAAILENPDDDAPYLVYADWLMGKGDPRGELIVMQHDADEAEGPRKAALKKAAKALFEQHAAYFLGPLANAKDNFKALWRYGYVRKLELQWPSKRSNSDDALALLSGALQHPSCRFILDLQVGCVFDMWELDFQGVVDTLTALKKPYTVRSLDLGITSGMWMDTGFGEFSELVAALPNLRRIRLRERRFDDPRPDDPVHEMMIKRARKS
jgi:uncharacterized protein (TIGR02996 family)